jgi:hypothetical protein
MEGDRIALSDEPLLTGIAIDAFFGILEIINLIVRYTLGIISSDIGCLPEL